jgi:glyoxylase-like metal-dependent hydrolase (beta-lactamase superfamily II)
MPEIAYVCTTCACQYPPSVAPPAHCPICEDERQYVNAAGQGWTTPDELRATRRIDWRELERGLFGMGATPQVGIGQRALIVPQPGGGVMWDCIPLVSEEGIARIRDAGGLRAIGISHPHFFSAMVDWSEALGNVAIYLHEDLRRHVTRPSPNIHYWSGETHDLGQGVTLVRCGGHFAGSTALHWAGGAGGKGVLFGSDTLMVVPDTRWVSFMRSFPNLIPLNASGVKRIVASVAPFAFERIYSGWWDRVCREDAKARVSASAERYLNAIAD